MIEKSHAGQIINLGGTYTTLPNEALDLIEDALTLGVWAYLISKPRNWRINKANVCQKLSIKERQYYAAIKQLKCIGLCREYCIRQQGRLRGKTIVIVSCSSDWHRAEGALDKYQSSQKLTLVDITKNTLEKLPKKTLQPNNDEEVTEIDKFRPSEKQRLQKTDVSVGESSPIYKKQINGNNKAAAIESLSQKSNPSGKQENQNAAASFVNDIPQSTLQSVETVIGRQLTDSQQMIVDKLSQSLNTMLPELALSPQDIAAALLDQKCYSKAGRDFWKKINTLRAQALKGAWQPASRITLDLKSSDAEDSVIKVLRSQLHQLTLDRSTLLSALRSPLAARNSSFLNEQQQCLDAVEQSIATTQSELESLLVKCKGEQA